MQSIPIQAQAIAGAQALRDVRAPSTPVRRLVARAGSAGRSGSQGRGEDEVIVGVESLSPAQGVRAASEGDENAREDRQAQQGRQHAGPGTPRPQQPAQAEYSRTGRVKPAQRTNFDVAV